MWYWMIAVQVQEFVRVECAQQIMESDLRYQFNLDGAPLRLDYSHGAQPAAAVSASASSDWICPGCNAVNFSRWACCLSSHLTLFIYQNKHQKPWVLDSFPLWHH